MKQQTSIDYLVELRDDFALEAMKIIMNDSLGLNVEQIAIASYQIADAMIKVREVKNY